MWGIKRLDGGKRKIQNESRSNIELLQSYYIAEKVDQVKSDVFIDDQSRLRCRCSQNGSNWRNITPVVQRLPGNPRKWGPIAEKTQSISSLLCIQDHLAIIEIVHWPDYALSGDSCRVLVSVIWRPRPHDTKDFASNEDVYVISSDSSIVCIIPESPLRLHLLVQCIVIVVQPV